MLNRATPRFILIAAVLAVLLGGILVVGQQRRSGALTDPAAAGSDRAKLGVFRGTSLPDVTRFSQWLGRAPDYVEDFKPRQTWAEIANPQYLEEWRNSPYRLVYAVPMLPQRGADERTGAAGAYDTYFVQLARHLVSIGQGGAILRVGWEFNIAGWPWRAKDPLVFIHYWRHIVTAMRTVAGQHFQFDWNPEGGDTTYDAAQYYPGNAYVDYVGVDEYDATWQRSVYPYPASCDLSCRRSRQEQVWNYLSTSRRGLLFWADFARTKGRALSLPEWGMWSRPDGRGGGDDPFYVEKMHEFIDDPVNNVAYQCYFDFDSADGQHTLQQAMPLGGQEYRRLFGPQ